MRQPRTPKIYAPVAALLGGVFPRSIVESGTDMSGNYITVDNVLMSQDDDGAEPRVWYLNEDGHVVLTTVPADETDATVIANALARALRTHYGKR